MKTEKRTISMFAIDIIIVLVDAPEDSPAEISSGGSLAELPPYANAGVFSPGDGRKSVFMVFRGIQSAEVIVHECWHAFFRFLDIIDSRSPPSYSELGRDIYAYQFAELHSRVLEKLTGMRLYKELWKEKEAKEGQEKER